MNAIFLRTAVAAIVVGLVGLAAADSSEERTDRFRKWRLSTGYFLPSYSTSLNLSTGTGGELLGVNFEDVLGISKDVRVFRLDGEYWMTRRDGLAFAVFGSRRNSTIALREDVQIGDIVFPAGAGVRTRITEDQVQLKYKRVWSDSRGLQLTGSIGLHVTKFGTSVETTSGVPLVQSASATAPLPLIGIGAGYFLSDSWLLQAEGEGLSIRIGDVSGRIVNIRLNVQYLDKSGWGAGVGWDFQNIRVRADSNTLDGEFEYRYSGPQLYFSYAF